MRNDRAHAQRNIFELGLFAGPRMQQIAGVGHVDHLARVVFQEVDGFGGVGVGFGPRLADLEDHPRAELVFAAAHFVGGLEQHLRPFLRIDVTPALKSLIRSLNRTLGIFFAALRKRADHFAGPRRVDRIKRFAGPDFFAADAQRVFAA